MYDNEYPADDGLAEGLNGGALPEECELTGVLRDAVAEIRGASAPDGALERAVFRTVMLGEPVALHSTTSRSVAPRRAWRRVGMVLCAALAACVVIALMLPDVQSARQSARVAEVEGEFGQITSVHNQSSVPNGEAEGVQELGFPIPTASSPYYVTDDAGYVPPAADPFGTSVGQEEQELSVHLSSISPTDDASFWMVPGDSRESGRGATPSESKFPPVTTDKAPHRMTVAVSGAAANGPDDGVRGLAKQKGLADGFGDEVDVSNTSRLYSEAHNREAYARINDNPFLAAGTNPLSTFSIDVDTASYANVRRFLKQGQLPPPDAVRIEELLNYFSYDYAPPAIDAAGDNAADDAVPFAVHTETAACPWRPEHRLLRIGLKGRAIDQAGRKAANLVFLLDVSGSMDEPNKLPLVKGAMRLLIDRLTENDRVAIVVYAGASGLVLPPTPGDRKAELHAAIERLQAGGSTNGGQGIELAYQTAVAHFITGGINRVILATDGDFNVGVTSDGDLTRLIEQQAKSGVFLSVLGFGEGNLQDAKMEGLADKGNGNYAYIDTLAEARKVFVEQLDGTLVTIAKDVKLQIEFNPAQVAGYRLIGYENRVLRAEDFADDRKDAGEIGAGHAVTALYEIVPVPQPAPKPAKNGADAPASSHTNQPQTDQPAAAPTPTLKYQTLPALTPAAGSGELLTLRLRYKRPDGDTSTPIEFTVQDAGQAYGAASVDFKHAAAVAGFGMLLRGSEHRGNLTWDAALELAGEAQGSDIHGYRAEFVSLVRRAKEIAGE